MKVYLILLIMILAFTAANRGTAPDQKIPLSVVPQIDPARYAGRWYEIARLPNEFEADCAGDVTSDFALRTNGKFTVINACRTRDGKLKQAKGQAKQADKEKPNSMLKVSFAPAILSLLPVVWGDYFIIELAPDYSYSMVGTPDRRYLWILSRTPQLNEPVYQSLVVKARALGFDLKSLQKTKQAIQNTN